MRYHGYLIALCLFTASAAANPPAQYYDMSLPLASSLAKTVLETCQNMGQSGVVAVVDRGGQLVALLREDDVGPHNTQAAQRKAFTALSTKNSTTDLAERARQRADSRNLTTLPELLLLGGGVPVRFNQQVIGAVGVAGMGGSANDHQCAQQAIATVLPDQQ